MKDTAHLTRFSIYAFHVKTFAYALFQNNDWFMRDCFSLSDTETVLQVERVLAIANFCDYNPPSGKLCLPSHDFHSNNNWVCYYFIQVSIWVTESCLIPCLMSFWKHQYHTVTDTVGWHSFLKTFPMKIKWCILLNCSFADVCKNKCFKFYQI